VDVVRHRVAGMRKEQVTPVLFATETRVVTFG
jgi:hypothetical protein